jgi:hypothetical protein
VTLKLLKYAARQRAMEAGQRDTFHIKVPAGPAAAAHHASAVSTAMLQSKCHAACFLLQATENTWRCCCTLAADSPL